MLYKDTWNKSQDDKTKWKILLKMRFTGEVYALLGVFMSKWKKNKTVCEENTLRSQRIKKNQKRIYDVYIHAYVYIDRHVYVVHVYTSMQKKKK